MHLKNAFVGKGTRQWLADKLKMDLYDGTTKKINAAPTPHMVEISKPVINDGK